jgi:hypothetical protein
VKGGRSQALTIVRVLAPSWPQAIAMVASRYGWLEKNPARPREFLSNIGFQRVEVENLITTR